MIQIASIDDPFRQPDIVGPTVEVLKRADAMGLVKKSIERLNAATFRQVVQSLQKAGIGRGTDPGVALALGSPAKEVNRRELLRFVRSLTDALEESPVPSHEWGRMIALFQPELELLAGLLGISLSSLRRYSGRHRDTPDEVAARLHFLALLSADLLGAYNELGVRNWFRRKRALLDGKAPKDILRGDWQPGDPGPERVRALARSLAAGNAT